MRVILFTECSKDIGYGHLIRCIALYEEVVARGLKAELVINGSYNGNELKGKHHQFINWLDLAFLSSYITKGDLCVIDSYLAEKDVYVLIEKKASRCLFIDDNQRIKYPQGIIVHPSLLSNSQSNNDQTILLGGPAYCLLRNAFKDSNRSEVNDEVRHLLVTLGGTDQTKIISTIILAISNIFDKAMIHVVGGSGYSALLKPANIRLYPYLGSSDMKQLMESCDLAVAGAGQTIYELLATNTPFIPIVLADNQKGHADALKKLTICRRILHHKEPDLISELLIELKAISDREERLKWTQKYQGVVDGFGVCRTIDYLLADQEYVLRNCEWRDREDIYQLSNEKSVRAVSLTNHSIPYKEHERWFDRLMQSDDSICYIISNKNDHFLGQVRYDMVTATEAKVSISLVKEIRGKGLSTVFLMNSIEQIKREKNELRRILAIIKKSNGASLSLFNKAGFEVVSINDSLVKLEKIVEGSL